MRPRWRLAVVGPVFVMLVAACLGAFTPPATGAAAAPPTVRSLVAPGAKVKLFASGLGYAEGPLWLPDGRLIVSDVNRNVVLAFDAAGHKSVYRRPSNIANGHALNPDGSVVEAEAGDRTTGHGQIARIAADGTVTDLADTFRGKRFNAPNDLIVRRDGTIWFTDPDYNQVAIGLPFHGVYRLDPKTKVVTLLTKALREPNGIAFSPDEKTLYVTDTENGLFSFPVAADGTLGPKRRLDVFGCDGIKVDEKGDVWATTCGGEVYITSPSGKRIGAISVPGSTSNLAWGGANGKTLFVTTQAGEVYSLALTVRAAH